MDAGKEDNDIVWGIVNDGLIYCHVNAAELKAPNGRGPKQLPLRVYLPHHELISCLQERVNPQAEGKPAVDLSKFQNWNSFPAKATYDDVPLPERGKPTTLSTFKLLCGVRTFAVTRSLALSSQALNLANHLGEDIPISSHSPKGDKCRSG